MTGDSKERYGAVSRVLHWGMGGLIGWQMLKIFDRINDGEHWVGETLVPWHVSIGSLLLVLVVLRLVWAAKQRGQRPEQEPAMAFWVNAGHALLYLGMVLMPITGLLILLGNGYPLKVFGVQLVAAGEGVEWMASVGGTLHSPVAWLLLIMIVGHAGMALLHHFVKKDGVLRRML